MSSLPSLSIDITTSKLLPALQHATSGSLGTVISTCALYPLSLVITRLQVQRQLQREGRLAAAAGREAGAEHQNQQHQPSLSATVRSTTRGDPIDPTLAAAYAVNATAAATASATANAAATRTSHPLLQRHLPPPDSRNPTKGTPSDYDGIADAFSKIYATEGGLKALYTGLASDAAKSLLDSFLFFMFYEWFRSIRLTASYRRRRGKGGLGALEELAIGVAAGACARALTAPIAHVVARKQTASMVAGGDEARGVGDIARGIKNEKGVKGLWAGFSASLILTLNPSITFFLQDFLRKKVVSKKRSDNPGAFLTFLMAATSKAVASAITYPFQTAKARMQSGLLEAEEEEDLIMLEDRDVDREVECKLKAARAARRAARRSIFGTLSYMARTEGVGSLYDGLQGELIKGFLGHGTTMVAKDAMHKLLFKLYFLMATLLSEFQLRRRSRNQRKASKKSPEVAIAMPMRDATLIDDKPLLVVEEAAVEKPKAEPKPKSKPKSKPAPIELPPKMIELPPKMIEEAAVTASPMEMEPPAPPQYRSLFEQAKPRRADFERIMPPQPFEQGDSSPRRSGFDPRSPFEQRSPFEPPPPPAALPRASPFEAQQQIQHRSPFEQPPRRMMENEVSTPAPMDHQNSVVLSSLPPALQYRMAPPEVSKRRQHVRTKTPVIVNLRDRSHREVD